MNTCNFKVPVDKTIFISFDNIQKLFKNYRLGVNEQDKAIATIITSVLCILPDGPLKYHIQFDAKLSPENWIYNFSINQKSKYAVPNIDNDILKDILKEPNKYLKNIRYLFRKKLEMAIKKVEEELEEDSTDSIDHSIAQTEAKKRKVCVKVT